MSLQIIIYIGLFCIKKIINKKKMDELENQNQIIKQEIIEEEVTNLKKKKKKNENIKK